MSWYGVASWTLIVAGLVPAAWFVFSWGRRVRWSLAAFDAGGWVFGLLAVYGFQAFVYLTVGIPDPVSTQLAAARLALGVLLDAVIIGRAVSWWRLRADFRARKRAAQGKARKHRSPG